MTAAQPRGPLQEALQPLDAGIERDVRADRVTGGVDAAGYATLGTGVDHAVALGVVGVDLPAEQVTVEAGEGVKVAAGDLEPHHWCCHRYLLVDALPCPAWAGAATASCRGLPTDTEHPPQHPDG